jgi:hypothetical protein
VGLRKRWSANLLDGWESGLQYLHDTAGRKKSVDMLQEQA